MASLCTICSCDFLELTPSRVESLIKFQIMTKAERAALNDSILKGFMARLQTCGHSFHSKCLLDWVNANYLRKVLIDMEALLQGLEQGSKLQQPSSLPDKLLSLSYSFKCPTCRLGAHPDTIRRIVCHEDSDEEFSNWQLWDENTGIGKSFKPISSLFESSYSGPMTTEERVRALGDCLKSLEPGSSEPEADAWALWADPNPRAWFQALLGEKDESDKEDARVRQLLPLASSPSALKAEMTRLRQACELRPGSILWYIDPRNTAIQGVVKWTANIFAQRSMIGVEFEAPIGDSSGHVGSILLFSCKPCHGYLAPLVSYVRTRRFRFDDSVFVESESSQSDEKSCNVSKDESGLRLGAKVIWERDGKEPEIGIIRDYCCPTAADKDEPNYVGVEFVRPLGHHSFNIFPHRKGHGQLVEAQQLKLYSDIYPDRANLVSCIPE